MQSINRQLQTGSVAYVEKNGFFPWESGRSLLDEFHAVHGHTTINASTLHTFLLNGLLFAVREALIN